MSKNLSSRQPRQLVVYHATNSLPDLMREINFVPRRVTAKREKIGILNTIMMGKRFWLSTLSELSDRLPHNMWITTLAPQFLPMPLLRIDGKIDGDFKDIEAFQKTLDSSIVFVGDTVMDYEIRDKTEDLKAKTGISNLRKRMGYRRGHNENIFSISKKEKFSMKGSH